MALNFPTSPANGDTYVVGNKTYIYDSTLTVWNVDPILASTIGAYTTAEVDAKILTDVPLGAVFTDTTYTDLNEFTNTPGYLTTETSHSDVLVDGDFSVAGIMKTDGVGAYSSSSSIGDLVDVDTTVAPITNDILKFDGTNFVPATDAGDMLKSVYDITDSGIVDNAELVNNLTVETAVPVSAVFTDTLTTVIDDLITGGTADALSAEQGKTLETNKIEAIDYAVSTIGGTIKARLSGTTLYLTTDGTDA